MTELKSDEEVLEFALSREIDAERFYADMAGQVDNPTLKKVLERLRKEEVVHRSRLELELMKKGRVVPDLAEPEEDLGLDETIVIGSEHVLAYKEILKRGMEREKKAIMMYERSLGLPLPPGEKEKIKRRIEEIGTEKSKEK